MAHVFAAIDEQPVLGVRGTILSKVLHRKRPRLIPLHDRYINTTYVPDPILAAKRRSWGKYLSLLMHAMRDDLGGSIAIWESLERIPPHTDPPLTRLRALDIVGWSSGRR